MSGDGESREERDYRSCAHQFGSLSLGRLIQAAEGYQQIPEGVIKQSLENGMEIESLKKLSSQLPTHSSSIRDCLSISPTSQKLNSTTCELQRI